MRATLRPVLCLTLAAMTLGTTAPVRAEAVLKAVRGWNPPNYAGVDCRDFFRKVNKAGKGIVALRDLGASNVVPTRKQGDALKRGVIDALCTAGGYYQGMVPETIVFNAMNIDPSEARRNGGFAMLQRVWEKKANAKLLANFHSSVLFRFYLSKKPSIRPDGLPDLTGFKLRVSPAHRAIVVALGGAPVRISVPEMYTGLERGVVQGLAWSSVGLTDLGVQKFLKYWIDPAFLHTSVTFTVNMDAWNKLSPKAQAVLSKAAEEHEAAAYTAFIEKNKQEITKLHKAGLRPFTITGAARTKFIRLAHNASWKRLVELTDAATAAKLKKVFYKN